jgi:8-oxo-dGTP diphosphatase
VRLPRFCTDCGGELAPVARHFVCRVCGRPTYLNSKPVASALVVDDGRLMLVRRCTEPFHGWWDIPGGFLEAGEHPADAVVRELREESGLDVRPIRLFGVYPDVYGEDEDPTLSIYYECEVVGGVEAPGDDAGEVGWFRPDDLPEQVAFAHASLVLADWRASRGRP